MSETLQPLSDETLLAVWEQARMLPPSDRMLALVRAALPESEHDAMTSWCIGESDAFLLDLYQFMFGDRFDCSVTCPACRAELEVSLGVDQMRFPYGSGVQTYQVVVGTPSRLVSFRLPRPSDLRELWEKASIDLERLLIERCIVRDNGSVPLNRFSDDDLAAISDAMGKVDPQSMTMLDSQCPDCGHAWEMTFDIADFLWKKIDNRSHQLLGEIHSLARGYGWTETEILSLSETRRKFYFELLEA